MAVIDQDNFSNISWHSENAPGGASSNHAPEEGAEYGARTSGEHDDLAPGRSGEILECTVSEPHKENDGTKDAYVSYLITTNVSISRAPPPSRGHPRDAPALCGPSCLVLSCPLSLSNMP